MRLRDMLAAAVRPGDRVAVQAIGIVGTVSNVDPRCVDGSPCPCCGRGVSVQPDGDPNSAYGVAPADCLVLSSGPAMFAPGGNA